jgi:hypothetical protein
MKAMLKSNARLLRKPTESCFTFLNQLRRKSMSGLWEKANRVSEIGYKIHSAAMIVELVAEKVTDKAESGALWAASEILQQYSDELEELAVDIMSANRLQEDVIAKLELKKGKKK